jgi:hypothetical protein
MGATSQKAEQELFFPVPTYRFDQKNEMFKRSMWDEKFLPAGKRFYREVKYQVKIGFRKMDLYVFKRFWTNQALK